MLQKTNDDYVKNMEEMVYKNSQVRITDTAVVYFLLLVVNLMILLVTHNESEDVAGSRCHPILGTITFSWGTEEYHEKPQSR
jgi:hypothetical protein